MQVFRSVAVSKLCVAVLLVAAAAWAGIVRADDVEDPVFNGGTTTGYTVFGSTTLLTSDVGGQEIDARETVEPQLTVEMTTSPYQPSSSGMLEVSNQPLYESADPSADLSQ